MTLHVSFHTYPHFWPFPVSWKRWSKLSDKYQLGHALRVGMKRHGVRTSKAKKYEVPDSDIAVVWSWKQHRLIEGMLSSGRHVLVLERGFLPNRKEWCSLALDGFNGRGRFAPPADNGERWRTHFAHHLKPWKEGAGEYVLVIGKGANDVSLHGASFMAWLEEQVRLLLSAGHRVVYRPHPDRPTPCPEGAELSTRTLKEDLACASFIVSFNSSTDVEAVLSGVPAVITDPGSLAYPVAAHSVLEPLSRPDRTKWCHALAWRQWTAEELRNGDAWDHVKQLLA
ncbi:hypothetical protein KEU06_20225 [Pseudaminobacter sp. 19-2017]|uniref:Uncharacterized protein n=1 Tax=Pseudaminobacter soli (ex Zhang et al. 2022) TaxID=2831468 RepID=A0A942I457_9HYPH|nr:hypothetical protein [Pseudaminobacter soli]MBS3650944.1 hypothetical protein [Pseudaminobacter soli]